MAKATTISGKVIPIDEGSNLPGKGVNEPFRYPAMSRELESIIKATEAVDTIASNYRRCAGNESMGRLIRSMLLADTIEALEKALTPEIMARLVRLQGSRLGFLTDKDKTSGYDAQTIKRCVIEGLIRGVFPLMNELNIIAGNCYVTKEGYERLVGELPGLTDLDVATGTPVVQNGQMACRVAVRWKMHNVPNSLKGADGAEGRTFAIITHGKESVDAVQGKAKRKALAAVHFLLTKSEQSAADLTGDVPSVEAIETAKIEEAQTRASQLTSVLRSRMEAMQLPGIEKERGEVEAMGPSREPGEDG